MSTKAIHIKITLELDENNGITTVSTNTQGIKTIWDVFQTCRTLEDCKETLERAIVQHMRDEIEVCENLEGEDLANYMKNKRINFNNHNEDISN